MILRLLRRVLNRRRALYVRVGKNELSVRDAYSGEELRSAAPTPFTTTRLLIGDFTAASNALQELTCRLYGAPAIRPDPTMVVHPLEMTEGGLSGIETRAFYEFAGQVSTRPAKIHVGRQLTDAEVLELLRGA